MSYLNGPNRSSFFFFVLANNKMEMIDSLIRGNLFDELILGHNLKELKGFENKFQRINLTSIHPDF